MILIHEKPQINSVYLDTLAPGDLFCYASDVEKDGSVPEIKCLLKIPRMLSALNSLHPELCIARIWAKHGGYIGVLEENYDYSTVQVVRLDEYCLIKTNATDY